MAETPNIKINFDFSETMTAAILRVTRHTAAMGLAMELSSEVDPDVVQECLEGFPPPPDGDVAMEIDHIRQAVSNIRENVVRDLQWLLAADEHIKALEAIAPTTTTTED